MKIHNLATVQDGKITGAMSPMLFSKEICKGLDIKFCGLARIWWDNDRTLQYEDEDSGMDSLIIYEEFTNNAVLYLFLDTGVGGIPIAFRTRDDEEITYTPVYRDYKNLIKPSDEEIALSFNTIFNDMSLITPKVES